MYNGIGASSGFGIGKIVIISNAVPVYTKHAISDVQAESRRFAEAVELFISRTTAMAEAVKSSVGEHNAEILNGHITMISDPFMQDEINNKIADGECAEQALDEVCDMFIMMFEQSGDELTMQRASDIKDIRLRLLRILTGTPDISVSEVPAGTILVAKDLTPSMTAGIIRENVEGIITEVGGKTSHSAILARALEIPAVLSVQNITSLVSDGMEAVINGNDGTVILNPDELKKNEYLALKQHYIDERNALNLYRGKPTQSSDNIVVHLYGNIGKPGDAAKVIDCDGEGIGLFRTEFLFMESSSMPDEDEQFRAYRQVAEAMKDKEVIIRTLDIGGDKEIPYLGLEKEDNPFLGYRAIRYCLQNTELYRIQLRALLRASAYGNIQIMIPLVTCVDEIRAVKELVKQLKCELDAEGVAYNPDIKIGVMVETAAASEIADLLAREADFFSIGTNDLTQYTMAVDRGNAKVAYLYSTYNPAVLRSIRRIISAAADAGIPVGMCGEAAADPLLTPLLIAFGLNEYSVGANSILATRASIAKWSLAEAKEVACKAMSLATESEVAHFLKESAR